MSPSNNPLSSKELILDSQRPFNPTNARYSNQPQRLLQTCITLTHETVLFRNDLQPPECLPDVLRLNRRPPFLWHLKQRTSFPFSLFRFTTRSTRCSGIVQVLCSLDLQRLFC